MRRQKLLRLRSGDMELGKEEVVGVDDERSAHEEDAAWPAIVHALAELRGVIERCLGNIPIQFPVESDHLDLFLRSCSMSVDRT